MNTNFQWSQPRQEYIPPQAPPPRPMMPGDVNEGVKVLLYIAAVFVPIIGIIAGAIFMGNANPRNQGFGRNLLITGIVVAVIACICMSAGVLESLSNLSY